MAVVQSVGALADLNTGWWPTISYGSVQMYDRFNYDYATLYKQQPNVRTCVDFLARHRAARLHFGVSETDREVGDHPLAQLLSLPLPAEFKVTTYRLIESLMGDLGVYFNAFWLKVKVPDAPIGLLRIPPDLVTVKGSLFPTGYEISFNGSPKQIAPGEIVHFRGYNPEDPVNGLSPLETLRRVLAEEHAAGD
jgi:phage portal protein BeeE